MTQIDDSGHVLPEPPTGEITVQQLDALIAELRAQRTKVEEMSALLAPESIKVSRLQSQIAAALKSLGRDKYTTEQDGTFSFVRSWRFNLPPEGQERDSFIDWLRENGIDKKYLTVNSNSYNSLMNQEREKAIREGRLLSIPGVPQPTAFETVRLTKGK